MSATGNWTATIESPIGKQQINLDLVEDGSAVTGTATASDGDLAEIFNGTATGNELSFKLTVLKPMKMTIQFAITVAGDSFRGTAKPGIFPASTVTGVRD
jgi:hypothetical protein